MGWPSQRPYLVVELPSEKEARLIGTRAILVKNIWRYWASADTYEQLHELVKAPEQRVHWVSSTLHEPVVALTGLAFARWLLTTVYPFANP